MGMSLNEKEVVLSGKYFVDNGGKWESQQEEKSFAKSDITAIRKTKVNISKINMLIFDILYLAIVGVGVYTLFCEFNKYQDRRDTCLIVFAAIVGVFVVYSIIVAIVEPKYKMAVIESSKGRFGIKDSVFRSKYKNLKKFMNL